MDKIITQEESFLSAFDNSLFDFKNTIDSSATIFMNEQLEKMSLTGLLKAAGKIKDHIFRMKLINNASINSTNRFSVRCQLKQFKP